MADKETLKRAAQALARGDKWGGKKLGQVSTTEKRKAARKNGKKYSGK